MTAEEIIKNMERLKSDRSLLNSKLEDIASFACPEKSVSFFGGTVQEGQEPVRRVIIDDVSEANSIFARGLYSNLCPPGTQSFQFGTEDPKFRNDMKLKAFFTDAGKKVFELMGSSNYSTELAEAFEDFGWAGLVNVSVEPDFAGRVFRFRNYHLSEYYISESPDKQIEEVYREFKLTARQLVEKYGDNTLPEEIRKEGVDADKAKSDKQYTLIHAVYPNRNRKLDEHGDAMLNASNKLWKSVTVVKEKKAVIRDSGVDMMPYTVARFEKKAKSAYGFSPGLRILRSAKMLNKMTITLMRASQKAVDPPVMLDESAYQTGMPMVFFDDPGARNFYDSSRGSAPTFAQVPGRLDAGEYQVQKLEKRINDAYFVNLFQMLQQLAETNKNKTAFEVSQLVNEKNTLIIPIVARIIDEFFTPLYLKCFRIAWDAGAFEKVPDYLPRVSVTFNSPLALAAKQANLKSSFAFVNQVSALAQVDPTVLDWVKSDELVRLIAEGSGCDPAILRSKSEVEDLRKMREQMQAQQQQMAMMAEAAKNQNLYKAPEAGSPASSAMEALTQI